MFINMKSRFLIMLAVAMTLLSCNTSKNNSLAYFTDLGDSGTLPNTADTYRILIQPDDELVIAVSSSVPEATAAYNVPMNNPATRSNMTFASSPQTQTYIVDTQGNILMPVLGPIHVAGKTTDEIAKHITALVSQDVKDPYVRVELLYFNIDVMGEVKVPSRVTSRQQNFTVLDALSSCGDLTEYGQRDRVFVIRNEGGQRVYHRLDLTKSDVFSSPYFHLKQGDVVYVEPNKIRTDNSKYNQNNAFKLSVISTIVSSVSVIASLIIALTR